MDEYAKKRFSGCRKKSDTDRSCTETLDKNRRRVGVCVGTEKDMGKRTARIITDNNIKSYERVEDLAKELNRMGVPYNEKVRVTEFVSKEFRDSRIEKTETTAGLNYGSIGVKGKRVRKTFV